jgi:hypothetical protein
MKQSRRPEAGLLAHPSKQLCSLRVTASQDFIRRIGAIHGWMTLFRESVSVSESFRLAALEYMCQVGVQRTRVRF